MASACHVANIEFLKKGPWYLLHDVESMKQVIDLATAIVMKLDHKNIGIVGECPKIGVDSHFEENKAALLSRLSAVNEQPRLRWEYQFLTFCCIFLIKEVQDCLKQNSPQNVCRHFFDTFNERMKTNLFGDSSSDGTVVALMPLEISTTLMIELAASYRL